MSLPKEVFIVDLNSGASPLDGGNGLYEVCINENEVNTLKETLIKKAKEALSHRFSGQVIEKGVNEKLKVYKYRLVEEE